MRFYRSYFSCTLAFVLLTIHSFILPAQGIQTLDNEHFWKDVPEAERASESERLIRPNQSRLIEVRVSHVQSLLLPALSTQTQKEIWLPLPDGNRERFGVNEYEMMEAGLQAAFPQIHTWTGVGLDRPELKVNIDLTQKGFHALILGPGFSAYIDPYSSSDKNQYVSYFKKDYNSSQTYLELDPIEMSSEPFIPGMGNPPVESDGNLRTYRLAIAATGEYTTFHGGTVADAMAAITTTINRVNGIYERDLSVRMVLVNNNDQLIFTDQTTDPFSNNNANSILTQSQNTIDAVIGSGNYDIGHTFSTGSGGLAGLGVVCFNGYKAQGTTGRSNPVGDPFDIDYVAHEMGHQFGAHHTYNGSNGSCASNRHAPTAFEPGSGSTIMAYAGICTGQNLQSNSDAYFHSASLDEIIVYTTIGWGS
ncbi:MAG: hypothetical protein KDD99_12325, partial [Bacteroidetes bacterium]|nr:hypothetical protein [Bacteroidota bacterium]